MKAEEYEVKKPNSRKVPMACKNGVWDKNHPKSKGFGIPSPMDMD